MSPARARTLLAALLGALALLVPVALAPPASAATSRVTLVQALSGGPVDVSVAGQVLTGLAPGSVRDVGALPEGSHEVVVRRGGDVLVRDTASVSGGTPTSVVVHAASTPRGPRVAIGLNDAPAAGPPPGSGRMAVLYVGASGPIDVRVDGAKAGPLSGLETGGGAQGDMPPGEHSVAVTRAGSEEVLLPARPVDLPAGVTTNVYVFGGIEGGPLSLTAQQVGPDGAAAPGGGSDPGPSLRTGTPATVGGSAPGAPRIAGPAASSRTPAASAPPAAAGGPDALPTARLVTVTIPAGARPVSLKGGHSPFAPAGPAAGPSAPGDSAPGDAAPGDAAPGDAAPAADGSSGTTLPAGLALLLLAAAAGATVLALRRRAAPGSPAAP